MAYRRRSYRSKSRTSGYGRRRSSGRRGTGGRSRRSYSGGGSKTIKIVVEQAAPSTSGVVGVPNAAQQMASKRSVF